MFKFKRQKKVVNDNGEYIEKQVKKIPKTLTYIFLIYLSIFLIIVIWYFAFQSTHYISTVQGSSMKPTLNIGITSESQSEDIVYVNTSRKGSKGDIVVIENNNGHIIKRIIATEGDKVSIYITEDGYYHVSIVYANTDDPIILQEEYVNSYSDWTKRGFYSSYVFDNGIKYEENFYQNLIYEQGYYDNVSLIDGIYHAEVPEDHVFCLGDNRSVSSDSRVKGFFKESEIKGVADIIIKGGALEGGASFGKRFSAIISYYWSEIEKSFAR